MTNAAGEERVVYDFKLHALRHTAASVAIQAGANIKALQNMPGHESAGVTPDRYGHLYGSLRDLSRSSRTRGAADQQGERALGGHPGGSAAGDPLTEQPRAPCDDPDGRGRGLVCPRVT